MNAQAVVLGFDTSCYTTSVAAVDLAGNPVVSCRKLLPVAMGERGLRQSDALFIHVRQLPGLVEELAEQIRGREIVAVCASTKPREDENSYMPVFQAGDAQARGVAALLGVPCFASNHQRGHIEAALVGTGIPEGPLLAVHLSGGTTELVQYDGEHVTLIGGSHDLHAGQVVDRTGVALETGVSGRSTLGGACAAWGFTGALACEHGGWRTVLPSFRCGNADSAMDSA